MKKIVLSILCFACVSAFAAPYHAHRAYRPPAHFHHVPVHHHHHSIWGRGGSNFWPMLGGIAVGALLINAFSSRPAVAYVEQPTVVQPVVQPQPTTVIVNNQNPAQQTVVVQPPPKPVVTTTQQVWVEGRFEWITLENGQQVQKWFPAHYETITVTQ